MNNQKLLNKILLTDRQENEDRIDQFTEENNIQRGENGTRETCLGITITFDKRLLALDSFFHVSVVTVE